MPWMNCRSKWKIYTVLEINILQKDGWNRKYLFRIQDLMSMYVNIEWVHIKGELAVKKPNRMGLSFLSIS